MLFTELWYFVQWDIMVDKLQEICSLNQCLLFTIAKHAKFGTNSHNAEADFQCPKTLYKR